jgi:hypothetical protein
MIPPAITSVPPRPGAPYAARNQGVALFHGAKGVACSPGVVQGEGGLALGRGVGGRGRDEMEGDELLQKWYLIAHMWVWNKQYEHWMPVRIELYPPPTQRKQKRIPIKANRSKGRDAKPWT